MKRIICPLTFVMLWASGLALAEEPPDVGPTTAVVVLSSQEIKQVPRAEHVHNILRRVASELKLARRHMPHIVMMYVRRSEANTQHLPKVSLVVEQARVPGHALYHVWIVDDVRDLATTQGLIMVLNDNFGLRLDDANVHQIRDRICNQINATVDYHALAEGK